MRRKVMKNLKDKTFRKHEIQRFTKLVNQKVEWLSVMLGIWIERAKKELARHGPFTYFTEFN